MKIENKDYINVAKACVRFNKRGLLHWYINGLITLENFSSFRLSKVLSKLCYDTYVDFLESWNELNVKH